MSLEELRFNLEEIQAKFLELWLKRKSIVAEIQSSKSNQFFDPFREQEIFHEFSESLKHFSAEELLAFSLIMQTHARGSGQYPNWYEGEHLNVAPELLFERINPILLRTFKPNLFNRLELTLEYQNIL